MPRSAPRRSRRLGPLVAVAFAVVMTDATLAQEHREAEGGPLPAYARRISIDRVVPLVLDIGLPATNGLPNVMLTGYWPPTNEMLRRFSPDPIQNPQGWIGDDWEGRGYNVYAFFPEFPHGLGKGEGDFEVDYQDTSADFWPIADVVKPVAMITFGRAYPNHDWELEWRKRNLEESRWGSDYETPYKPTPAPPDGSVPPDFLRYSSLPMVEIVDAVNQAGLGINAFADTSGNAGAFLCEYIGYHATWYHDLHAEPADPYPILSSGHVHVGSEIDLPEAIAATEVTVRALIDVLEQPLVPSMRILSEGTGGAVPMFLDAGVPHASRNYVVLAGFSGTTPGLPLPGGNVLPLNWDPLSLLSLQWANSSHFEDFRRTLDPLGKATSRFDTLGPLPVGSAGMRLYFAYFLPSKSPTPWYASNSFEVVIVP